MVEQRVSDRAFLNLIGKWLRAGIMEEDGKVVHPATELRKEESSVVCLPTYTHTMFLTRGLRSNSKLHAKDAHLHRYADDTVAVFQYHGSGPLFQRSAGASQNVRTEHSAREELYKSILTISKARM